MHCEGAGDRRQSQPIAVAGSNPAAWAERPAVSTATLWPAQPRTRWAATESTVASVSDCSGLSSAYSPRSRDAGGVNRLSTSAIYVK